MAHLVNALRPDGQSADYRFVHDTEADRTYKVKQTLDETPGRDPVLKLSISEVDAAGQAVRLTETDEPEIIWQSHTFTPTELADPEFDIEKRVSAMLYTAVEERERRNAARLVLADLAGTWGGEPAGLELEPPGPAVEPEQ